MAFRYTPAENRYVGSITDLMGRGNEAEAQALIKVANAQAQAAQASGQAWGGAVQGIGDTIAAIPGQMHGTRPKRDSSGKWTKRRGFRKVETKN